MSTNSTSTKVNTKRIYQIDLFRFIAAMGIMLVHYLYRGYRADNLTNLSFAEFGDWMKYFFVFIDLFFIISGFVIALSIKGKSLSDYLRSRVLRIFSVYWICVLITYLTIVFFGAPRFEATFIQFLANLTLMHDLVNIESIDGVYWTMVVEVKFYFLSVLYLAYSKYKDVKIEHCAYLWLALSILYVFFQGSTFMYLANILLIFKWAPAFIAGMLFANIYKTKKITTLNAFALLTCLGLSMYHRLIFIQDAMAHFKTDSSVLMVLLLIFLMYFLVFLVVQNKLKFLNKPIFLYLGILTYPLYLLHQNIGYIIFNNLMNHMNKYILLFGTIALMLALSYTLNRWIEAPLTKYLDSAIVFLWRKTKRLKTRLEYLFL
jgi:peptidoglycan/LPS O-acetylase OafA/YrhL